MAIVPADLRHFCNLCTRPNNVPSTHYLFVYGTLRKARDGSLHGHLRNRAEFLDTATLPGTLYEISGYPGAVLSTCKPASYIHGEVYCLLQADAVLHTLDRYEECSTDIPQPHEYRRVQRTVTLSIGKSIPAWVYLYNQAVSHRKILESGNYWAYLPAKHN